jgi:hypothetical protein
MGWVSVAGMGCGVNLDVRLSLSARPAASCTRFSSRSRRYCIYLAIAVDLQTEIAKLIFQGVGGVLGKFQKSDVGVNRALMIRRSFFSIAHRQHTGRRADR